MMKLTSKGFRGGKIPQNVNKENLYGFFKVKLNELCILQNNRSYSNEEKQMLERLETLESNSDKVIKDSVALMNRNIKLQKENISLNRINNLLQDRIEILKQENEKLKKVIEILKEHIYLAYNLANEFRDEQNQEYYVLCRLKRYLTKEQYYFLKEVLGDA